MMIRAPFNLSQCESLNAYQAAAALHPFTCPHSDCGKHETLCLIATPAGWVCPGCEYTQNWAHPWMADWSWREPSPQMWAALLGTARPPW